MWNATKPKKHIQGYGYSKKLLYLPDTDVYRSDVFNSVPYLRTVTPQFFVQLSGDPDFAIIPSEIRPKVLKTLYVLDVRLGKARFLHSVQILSMPTLMTYLVTLADTSHDLIQCGFLEFVRLIGTVYFKKHFAAFKIDSSRTYLNSFALGVSITGQHKKWLRE